MGQIDMRGSLAAAFRASRQEDLGARLEVDVVDLDRLGLELDKADAEAGEDGPTAEQLEAAEAAATRQLHFAPAEASGAYLEHYARVAEGASEMSNAEFHARWFRDVLPAAEWAWLRDQFARFAPVWGDVARESLRTQVMHLQLGRPTTPPSPSESSPSENGGGSSSGTDGGASTG